MERHKNRLDGAETSVRVDEVAQDVGEAPEDPSLQKGQTDVVWPSRFEWIRWVLQTWSWSLYDVLRNFVRYDLRSWSFLKVHVSLSFYYAFRSPPSLTRQYDTEPYGETPLVVAERIASLCRLQAKDIFFDLGCGTGRLAFWMADHVGCSVHAFDLVRPFVATGNVLAHNVELPVKFHCQNIEEVDFSIASCVYFYTTAFPDEGLSKVCESMYHTLPIGAYVVTVSTSMEPYDSHQCLGVWKEVSLRYPWGMTQLFVHRKTHGGKSQSKV